MKQKVLQTSADALTLIVMKLSPPGVTYGKEMSRVLLLFFKVGQREREAYICVNIRLNLRYYSIKRSDTRYVQIMRDFPIQTEFYYTC